MTRGHDGLVHRKVVGVDVVNNGKGVVLSTGNVKNLQKPAKRLNRIKLIRDSRRTLTTIRRTIRQQRYRKDLKMAALRRASALLRGQRLALTTAISTTTKSSNKTTTTTSS